MTAARKECASCGTESDTWKAKVERFIPARLIVAGIRRITKRDSRRQFAGRAFEVELMPNHFVVRKRLGVIWAGDADRAPIAEAPIMRMDASKIAIITSL